MLTTKQLRRIIAEELNQVLREEDDFVQELLTLLKNPDEEMKIQAVQLAGSMGMPEYDLAKEHTISYIKHVIFLQPYDIHDELKDQWKQPIDDKGTRLVDAYKDLEKISDPYKLLEEYKRYREIASNLEQPIEMFDYVFPAFIYKASDAERDGDMLQLTSSLFVNLHLAYYLEGMFEGKKFLKGSFMMKESMTKK